MSIPGEHIETLALACQRDLHVSEGKDLLKSHSDTLTAFSSYLLLGQRILSRLSGNMPSAKQNLWTEHNSVLAGALQYVSLGWTESLCSLCMMSKVSVYLILSSDGFVSQMWSPMAGWERCAQKLHTQAASLEVVWHGQCPFTMLTVSQPVMAAVKVLLEA